MQTRCAALVRGERRGARGAFGVAREIGVVAIEERAVSRRGVGKFRAQMLHEIARRTRHYTLADGPERIPLQHQPAKIAAQAELGGHHHDVISRRVEET